MKFSNQVIAQITTTNLYPNNITSPDRHPLIALPTHDNPQNSTAPHRHPMIAISPIFTSKLSFLLGIKTSFIRADQKPIYSLPLDGYQSPD